MQYQQGVVADRAVVHRFGGPQTVTVDNQRQRPLVARQRQTGMLMRKGIG